VAGIDDLLERMGALLAPMIESGDERRNFLSVYLRTTVAVKEALELSAPRGFEDPAWTERWDLAFADLYLEALTRWNEDGSAPGPWQVAFTGAANGSRVPPIRHLLVGMNAHINYDLPQALLEVITDQEFDDRELIARRARDHARIDQILAERVPEEARLLQASEPPGNRRFLDRTLTPLDRAGTERLLKDARAKVWRNAGAMSLARREGPAALKARLDELAGLSADRVAELREPGRVALRLSLRSFGVLLKGA
jgi:hypothetical protein